MRTSNRPVVASLSALFVLLAARSVVAQTSPPNIIFILTDDQGVDAIQGNYWQNSLNCHTPVLASLAEQGRVFTQTRVNPYCSPTRAGLMTGRSSLHTGVTGVVNSSHPLPDRDLLSLQTHEWTAAEMLASNGYYTILIDKWHLGWSRNLGLDPESQGFSVFENYNNYRSLDDPLEVGDEHVTLAVNQAIDHVLNRPDTQQPFALFFHTVDPHKRSDPTGKEPLLWWKVDPSLLPSGEDYYASEADSNRNRYRAVVEALDTELGRMLRSLGVLDQQNRYRPESNTIVFFLGDNGTPAEVAPDPNKAKGSLYEGGIRVPHFVFGAGVVADGEAHKRLIAHLDFFDTLADVVGAPPETRGTSPREGYSFADSIGYGDTTPRRPAQLLSLGGANPDDHQVAITEGRFKLVTWAGGVGFQPLSETFFFDLRQDPNESNPLSVDQMTRFQRTAYYRLCDAVSDYWPTAVTEPTPYQTDILPADMLAINSFDDDITEPVPLGHEGVGSGQPVESRLFVRFDLTDLESMLPGNSTIDDIVGAELILYFQSDSTAADATDTGTVRAHAMTLNWFTQSHSWNELVAGEYPDPMGMFDPPPYVIVDPAGDNLSGIPMPPGAPISLGHSDNLLSAVHYWCANPIYNYGLTISAEMLPELVGDQTILLQLNATLRLTVKGN